MQAARPTFLTVLCILTFIGSGWGIINAVSSYSTADVVAGVTNEAFDEALDEIDNSGEEVPSFVEKILGEVGEGLSEENIKNSAMASGISCILTLLGAILMWTLNKNGFWLYCAGIAVGVFAPMFIHDGILGAIGAGGAGFFGILFIILYGVNLKHLK